MTEMTRKPKSLTAAKMTELFDAAGIYPSKLFRSAGQYKVRKSYFYRPKRSVEDYAEEVAKVPGVKVVSFRDNWAQWPSPSYYEVTFTYEALS
jgi:hypothetical protein